MIRFILGTRPEAIKIKPILVALKGLGVAFDVVGTGQHASLLDGTGIKLDHDLKIPSQNDPEAYVDAVVSALCGGLGDRSGRTNEPAVDSHNPGGASELSGSRTPGMASASTSREPAERLSTSGCSSDDGPRPSSGGFSATRAYTSRDKADTICGSGPKGSGGTDNTGVALKQVSAEMRNVQRSWRGVSVIVVQGDTASALAGARAGNLLGIPVAHVEAGLRSHDLTDPWPEEGYRIEIDRLSAHHYCPTEGNLANLQREPDWASSPSPVGRQSHVTGNTITDALRLSGVKREHGNHVLVTLHRRESFGEPLVNVIRGLAAAAHHHPSTPFCWPVHPNPAIQDAIHQVSLPPNVLMRPALPYHHFLTFLASAKAVLTDSGGVIEEACTLGVPTVIARHHTERPEAIAAGNAQLVGTKSSAVWEGLDWAFQSETVASSAFGDGFAADKIAAHLQSVSKGHRVATPT